MGEKEIKWEGMGVGVCKIFQEGERKRKGEGYLGNERRVI